MFKKKEKAVAFGEDGMVEGGLFENHKYRSFLEAVEGFYKLWPEVRLSYPELQLANAVFRGRRMKRLAQVLHLKIPGAVKQLRVPVAVEIEHFRPEKPTALLFPVLIFNVSIWDFKPEVELVLFATKESESAKQPALSATA